MVIGYIYIYWGREGEGLETELVNKMVSHRRNHAANFYKIITETTVCLRSSCQFYLVGYCIKWVTTSWRHSCLSLMRTNASNKLKVH